MRPRVQYTAAAAVTLGSAALAVASSCRGPEYAGHLERAPDDPVLGFHHHPSRDGTFIDPKMTLAAAARMHLDRAFHPTLDGHVYAQPLYVSNGPQGGPAFLVATENNEVYAIDPAGTTIWRRSLGLPAARADECGNIQPLGVTGTPVVDPTRSAIYLDAARPGPGTTRMREHEIHALSLDDGSEMPGGWPVRASSVVGAPSAGARAMTFVPAPQNQRGALLIAGDTLYVPYGGHDGDCADSTGAAYHGWILGIPLDAPSRARGFVTQSPLAGIWSVGGLAFDGVYLFATTGNGTDGADCPSPPPPAGSLPRGWGQQEAILRFQPGPVWSPEPADYWVPANWSCLDGADADLGGSNPVLVDLPSSGDASSAPRHLVVAEGKDGKIYLADRTNLGGQAPPLAEMTIDGGPIMMAPISYTTARGAYVVSYGDGDGIGCPAGQRGNLIAVRITPGDPPTMTVAWCADEHGRGSPIFTTTDGTSSPLVWAIGAEGDDRLRAWNADTGAVVFNGGTGADAARGFHHFSTLIDVGGRIYAAADGTLYAYTAE